ncbi:MAG: helix-turn-helix domain-containing protein [Caldilineaceae bacterium]|nr:helix-turn-helix domain-containing protein [Caldilineaceae bacterium]
MKTERGKGARSNGAMAAPSIGPILRERREAMGVTLAEAEVATRIRQKYLSALESDEWDLVPGEVVGRGFLRNYATYLGLEPTEMIDRRRSIADESLAAVLADTSAGSALPPERSVDYRPKDVALRDETEELEAPRRINLVPFMLLLGVAAVATLVWWSVTQFSDEIAGGFRAVQEQIVAWQQPAPTPEPIATSATDALPGNLVAPTATAGAPEGAAAAPVEQATVEAQPTAIPTPVVEATPADSGVTILALLPTPTPQPEIPTPVPAPATPATASTAANLRGAPNLDSEVVGGAAEGETLTITGQSADGAWYQLQTGAWIFAQLVNNPPADVPVVATP